jgi:hypothetical protein
MHHKAVIVSDVFRTLIFTSRVDTICTMVQTFYFTAFELLDMWLACLLGRFFERTSSDSLDITHQELSHFSQQAVAGILSKPTSITE